MLAAAVTRMIQGRSSLAERQRRWRSSIDTSRNSVATRHCHRPRRYGSYFGHIRLVELSPTTGIVGDAQNAETGTSRS